MTKGEKQFNKAMNLFIKTLENHGRHLKLSLSTTNREIDLLQKQKKQQKEMIKLNTLRKALAKKELVKK